jgi:hypothetical protein
VIKRLLCLTENYNSIGPKKRTTQQPLCKQKYTCNSGPCTGILNLLTSWCRTLFQKLIVTQLVKKISCFLYGTQRFITVLTKARHWNLSRASRIQFAPTIRISLRFILMLSSQLRLGLRSGLLPSGLPTKTL